MKRLVIVYNPRSSHFKNVEEDVIEPARHLSGWMVAKYEVAQIGVDENTRRLAKLLQNDDLVIAAGGDGTATIAVNGVMMAPAKNVRLGVMSYGNFNDVSRTFGDMKFKEILESNAHVVWPLRCVVDGKHWRYAMCYVTVGMFAEACAVFDEPKTRKTLRKGGKRTLFSLFSLVKWWLREHKRSFIPSFYLGDASGDMLDKTSSSDYMAVNGLTVAKIMKGGRMFRDNKEFLSTTGELTRFWKLFGFMTKAVLKQVPAEKSELDLLKFNRPASVMIQAEGEYAELKDVKKIEVRKSTKPLLAVIRSK